MTNLMLSGMLVVLHENLRIKRAVHEKVLSPFKVVLNYNKSINQNLGFEALLCSAALEGEILNL